ncbi:MAG: protein kinase [Polyangiaceae bacterium]
MSGPTSSDGSADPRVGTTLSERYRIDSLLGEGGMGKVYAAEHVLMRKRLAVKILHRELTSVPEVVQRFEREAMAAANIEHPNVAAATDFGKLSDGSVFLVLEFVQGTNLRDEIAKGPMPIERALHVARQIASALASAHELEIVHRDLKPENVMLVEKSGDRDFVKVLDFGIARVPIGEANDGKAITKVGMVFGTPEYMAPEQALGQPVDGRADIYALGVILFEMISGVRPFSSKSPVGILGQQLSKPPPTIAERCPGLTVPPQVEVLLQRLLAKESSERIGYAKEVASTIQELLGPVPGQGIHKFTVATGSLGVAANSQPSFSSIPDLEAPSDPAAGAPLLSPAIPISAPGWEVPDADLPSAPASVPISYVRPDSRGSSADASGPHSLGLPVDSAARGSLADQSGPFSAVGPRSSALDAGNQLLVSVKAAWERVLHAVDRLRDKLPENIAGPLDKVPTATLMIGALVVVSGAAVGLIAVLVALVAKPTPAAPIVSAAPSGSTAPVAKPPGDLAPEAEFAAAQQGGVEGLQALASKFPKDGRIFVRLAVAQVGAKQLKAAVTAVEQALLVDPKLNTDAEIASVLFAAAQHADSSEDAFRILQGPMASKGADIVYDLSRGGNGVAKKPAKAWLGTSDFQKASSPALNVLVALNDAKSCRQRYALLLRAKNQGDLRVLKTLKGYRDAKAGCGRKGAEDCNPCMRDDDRLDAAIAEIEKRHPEG